MADFLFVFAKANLAMGVAILIVFLLRRPVRAAFHASIAYALWVLVPAMALASLLPPRAMSLAPSAMSSGAAAEIRLLIGSAASMPKLLAPQEVPYDRSWIVFAAWLAGTVAMILYLLWLQRGFHRAERAGLAGPALVGVIRPRIVVPTDFTVRFSASEQAAILAHEQAHLARQDARVNAVAALLRCLCWFNPLVHPASAWMRRDQELACDAAALRSVPRLDYANTLLKAQMPVVATPLGCAWPGSEHPLTERVALLKRPAPEGARRWAGILIIVLLTLSGGAAAWAQQESVPIIDMTNWKTVFFMYGKPFFYTTLEANKIQPIVDDAIQFTGPVRMQFPYGSAQAASGRLIGPNVIQMLFRPEGDVAMVVLNDVEVKYGEQTLQGKTLTYDPHTHLLSLDGMQMTSGIPQGQPWTDLRIAFQDGTGINLHYPPAMRQGRASTSDRMKLEMARQQHVTVSPAEVDTRLAELIAKNALPPLPAGTDLRSYVVAQIAWEKTRH